MIQVILCCLLVNVNINVLTKFYSRIIDVWSEVLRYFSFHSQFETASLFLLVLIDVPNVFI